MAGPWAGNLRPELSQGDLLSPVPVGSVAAPERHLKRGATQKHGVLTWQETGVWHPEPDGRGLFLALGRKLNAVVLSHDCEIDKEKRLLVAPVLPMDTITGDALEAVRNGKRYPFMPLPEIPDVLTESYVDLRGTCFVERELIDDASRLCSMSDDGVERLQAQLIAYFTHIPLSELRIPPTK